jgi:RimJ/RimL family protein N-acetyltransferase
VGAALAWADDALPVRRYTALIDVEHVVSQRVALKLGFHELARTNYHGEPMVLFER